MALRMGFALNRTQKRITAPFATTQWQLITTQWQNITDTWN
jgi:hypothetical protein